MATSKITTNLGPNHSTTKLVNDKQQRKTKENISLYMLIGRPKDYARET